MKMNTSIRKTPKGVTLIELSVVIAVILVLISVLFIGASYYRDSASNAACQINQSAITKAAEAYMNIEQAVSSVANLDAITGADLPFAAGSAPVCPGGGGYVFTATGGEVTAMACTGADPEHDDAK